MKRAAAVAALVALLALPAMAQRGGAHGGSGGHASGGFSGHAGFSGGSAAPHFGGFASRGPGFTPRFGGFAPRYGNLSPRFGGYAPRGYAPYGYSFAPRSGAFTGRMPYRGNEYNRVGNAYAANGRTRYGGNYDHHRRPYYSGFNGLPYAYNYGAWPWYAYDIDPWLFGPDWDDWDDNSDQSAQNNPNAAPYPDYGEPGPGYGEPGGPYGEPAPEDYGPQQPYPPAGSEQYQPSASSRIPYTGGSAASPQHAVIIIFKNGDTPETVHNYMLTASTLTVLDDGYQQIPVDQIDIPATEDTNRAAGIHFIVPGAAR